MLKHNDFSAQFYNISEKYHEFLCNIVGLTSGIPSYYILARSLDKKDFHWLIDADKNRAEDGKQLRLEFITSSECPAIESTKDDQDTIMTILDGPCSVLEMLVALSRRMSFIAESDSLPVTPKSMFWEIATNSGLIHYSDDRLNSMDSISHIDDIIDKLIDRKYGPDGSGGLFPIPRSKKDQRKIEIWYQMNEYLVSNNRL